ncbi:MAG: PEP-CTERM sorting domain-containing protein [Planctomycetota bacterium]|nr:PEP-CTERM sorting domain-containing protein [Planctomycetota bacterium]
MGLSSGRVALLALVTTLAPAAFAGTANPANDFTLASNPAGYWGYGYSSTRVLGSEYNPLTTTHATPALNYWEPTTGTTLPCVVHNSGPSGNYGTIHYDANQLALHPGPDGNYAILRFTPPAADNYQVAAEFLGLDFVGPTTTDVHVLLNGAPLFNAMVNGFGPASSTSYNASLALVPSDTLDFVAGFGPDQSHRFDTTALYLTISSPSIVPEPASLGLVAVSILVLYRRRRA